MFHFVVYLPVVSAILLDFVVCQTLNDTKTLTETRMRGYNKYVRPVANQSEPVEVSMDLFLMRLQELDEKLETLSVLVVVELWWHDASMVWDPQDYDGVEYFRVSYEDVWVPDLILTNPADDIGSLGAKWQRVTYLSNGYGAWYPGAVLRTTCSVNLRLYPFDTQECIIEFYPWGLGIRELVVSNSRDFIDINSFFVENGAWSIIDTSARSEIMEDISRVRFALKIKRKPAFVIVNVVIPIVFLSFINVLVFCLPVESGERMSYCITVLLSIAVFMTIVSDTLPRSSDSMPIMAYTLMADMILSSLTTLVVILNLKLFYKSQTSAPVPAWLKRLLHHRCLCYPRKIKADTPVLDMQSSNVLAVETVTNNSEFQDVSQGKKAGIYNRGVPETHGTCPVTWKDVSSFIDKIALVAFLFATALSFVLYIAVAWSNSK